MKKLFGYRFSIYTFCLFLFCGSPLKAKMQHLKLNFINQKAIPMKMKWSIEQYSLEVGMTYQHLFR